MANTSIDGPFTVYGNLANIPANVLSPEAVPDPNQDAGPSMFFQGISIPDPRFIYPIAKVTGFTGVNQGLFDTFTFRSVGIIPTAAAVANIAAAANVTSGTAMTLAASSLGVTSNVPIHPMSQVPTVLNGTAVVTAPLALDFGFAFGNVTSGSKTVTVTDSTIFPVGMPIVIGGVGNSGGTIPLLTNVLTLASATTITIADSPAATNTTAPIGTGDRWGPSEVGFPTPTAAYPFKAAGPGLFLDSAQSLARAVRITGSAGGTGGTLTVAGWDVYCEPMTETITVGAGAVTGWGKKAFKYINNVTSNFTDAHNYSVGTSDVFGWNVRMTLAEEQMVWWNGILTTTATNGFTAADTTSPATATTGDVRGTIQTSTNGGGTGIGSTVSNGSLSSLALTGVRLEMRAFLNVNQMIMATQANPVTLFGQQQV